MIYKPAEDSFLLQDFVRKLSKGKSFLDMGSGSGIQALTAKKAGAKSVLAVDISQESIKALRKLKIQCLRSDLFSEIGARDYSFDLIAFNPPYLPEDSREDRESRKATTGGKKGDETTLRFLEQAPGHLKKRGIILIVSSSLTPENRISALIAKSGMKRKKLAKKKLFMETLWLWQITL